MIRLKNPTKEQFENLPSNTRCPCSRISFPYGKFISIQTTFHQICSSELVSNRWLKAINLGANATYFPQGDFQTFGSAQFQALAGFCRLSKVNIEQSMNSFYLSTFLSPQVLSETDLQSQVHPLIDELQLTAPNTFNNLLRLVNIMIRTNELMNGLLTAATYRYYFFSSDDITLSRVGIGYKQDDEYWCICQIRFCSWSPSGIHKVLNRSIEPFPGFVLWQIPGISSGCLPVRSILLSGLECFYNQPCLDKLISYFPTNETFKAMNDTEQSRYYPNSTVQAIVDKLMIEDWIINISYINYYSQCAPSLCTYYKVSRHSGVYVLIKLISLLASLALVFRLIIPIIVRFIQWLKDRRIGPRISICARFRTFLLSIRNQLVELNIFRHYPSTNTQIRHQRYATRLYILLFFISIVILTIYTLSQGSIQSKTIFNPSQSEYIQLQQDYLNSLSCSCTSNSMPYSTFIELQPYYHQVCSSDFISEKWMTYTHRMKFNGVHHFDYRAIANTHFQTLSMFCQEAEQTINDSLRVFFETEFVSLNVISQQSFEFQINSLIENWKFKTINTFQRTVRLVREITHGNQLSNGGFNSIADVNPITGKATIQARSHGVCNCALNRLCGLETAIYQKYQFFIPIITYSLPNFFTGCYTIEALLASTLECFYNLSCMLTIHNSSHEVASEPFTFSPLDKNLSQPNEAIYLIVYRLMVDRWFSNYSFSLYYEKCAPSSCTFEYEDNHHFGYVVTTIIGLYGGLSLGLQLIIWVGLRFIEQIMLNGCSILVVWHLLKRIFSFNNNHKLIRRLHFILVVAMLLVFYRITAFNLYTKSVEIQNITLSNYEDLLEQSYDSLQCPCSQISIKYKSFLNIEPRYHQICSSDFVSNQWILYLFNRAVHINELNQTDFYHTAYGQFQLLQTLCKLSIDAVNQSFFQLIESDFINTEILSPNLFGNHIQSTINEFQSTMPHLFINTLSLIREMIGANMLLTVFSTNWAIETPSALFHGKFAHTIPLDYQECNCAVSFKCISPSRGMLSGCYPLETILQSTLECLFIPTCINITNNFKILNISLVNSSRFALNTTVESIVNKLMVEEFANNMSYASYFNLCAPKSCSYLYDNTNDKVERITTLIGLYGGLSIICLSLSTFIVKQFSCRTQRVSSITD
ncbi:unnamed protein product [Adineta steineri]|uniref:Uncharacterized protein n=1 Tax=Adineta steineri TaxID=433720 RepID=A0A814YKH0_9BILA|nr:unnamed protein product [Adineta steineri]CAF1567540.1 unnamed protein product [Adineta steineri]